MWPDSQKAMGHHGWVSLILSQHSVHFSGQGPCGIGDIKLLICHVISCDHVMRGSCESMCEFPSSCNHCNVNFGDHTPTLQRKKYFIFICQWKTLQIQLDETSCLPLLKFSKRLIFQGKFSIFASPSELSDIFQKSICFPTSVYSN